MDRKPAQSPETLYAAWLTIEMERPGARRGIAVMT